MPAISSSRNWSCPSRASRGSGPPPARCGLLMKARRSASSGIGLATSRSITVVRHLECRKGRLDVRAAQPCRDGAAQDAAQHVAAAARCEGSTPSPIRKARRARMWSATTTFSETSFSGSSPLRSRSASLARRARMIGRKQVGLVVGWGRPAAPRPSRSRPAPVSIEGFGSGVICSPDGVALELHEDQIPDLHEAPGLARRVVVRVLGRARPSRSGSPSRVHTARCRPSTRSSPSRRGGRSSISGRSDPVAPDVEGLVVVLEDRDDEIFRPEKPTPFGQQRPGELDRLFLEVVAEGEVPEHLEEGVVARRAADVLEVVVLARHAHALLRRRART